MYPNKLFSKYSKNIYEKNTFKLTNIFNHSKHIVIAQHIHNHGVEHNANSWV